CNNCGCLGKFEGKFVSVDGKSKYYIKDEEDKK
ncbi:unnamed protein product, partial [marine sediment metagenome]